MNNRTVKQPMVGLVSVLAAGACALTASAQSILYGNNRTAPDDYGVVTGTVTLSGVAAPQGAGWSEVPSDATGANAVAGFAGGLTEPGGGFRFADDFTVPPGVRWRIDKIVFFAYHTSPTGTITLPFDTMNFRVTRGTPADQLSPVVFGDTTTNRLSRYTPTNCFRVFNTTAAPAPLGTDFTRNVCRIEADTPGFSLAPGEFWLDWQFIDNAPLAEVFAPPVTHRGQRGVGMANAMQFRPLSLVGGGSWISLIDPGKIPTAVDVAQDLPFIIYGQAFCQGDLDVDGSFDLNDFFLFLNGFDTESRDGDINSDGAIDLTDFFLFLNLFDVGCEG